MKCRRVVGNLLTFRALAQSNERKLSTVGRVFRCGASGSDCRFGGAVTAAAGSWRAGRTRHSGVSTTRQLRKCCILGLLMPESGTLSLVLQLNKRSLERYLSTMAFELRQISYRGDRLCRDQSRFAGVILFGLVFGAGVDGSAAPTTTTTTARPNAILPEQRRLRQRLRRTVALRLLVRRGLR